MPAKVRVQLNKTWIEVDAADAKDAMRQLTDFTVVFGEHTCGACKSTDISYGSRLYQDKEFFGAKCTKCGAELTFFSNRDGSMYAVRKSKDGQPMPNNGWKKWEKQAAAF